jgi:Cys-tRNA(Pro)/Cys-tRNA(Cys) deacylase
MTDTIQSAVTALLNDLNIAYDIITIPLTEDNKPIRNLEALLTAEGRDPTSVMRSLLFRTGSNQFVLLAVPGGERADWAALRKHLGERKLKMADFEQVEEATGYVVGAVPPIALPEAVQVLLDDAISNYDDVIIGSGVLGYALALSSQDLKTAMGSEVHMGHFTKPDE